jgi:hypothetical protein
MIITTVTQPTAADAAAIAAQAIADARKVAARLATVANAGDRG